MEKKTRTIEQEQWTNVKGKKESLCNKIIILCGYNNKIL